MERGVSASYVSQVTKTLDEEVKALENAVIQDDVAFLFLDGLDVKILVELKVKRYKLLVACGIRRDGSPALAGLAFVWRTPRGQGPGVHFWRT